MTEQLKSIAEILRDCGTTEAALSPRERDALDQDGYVVLLDVVDARWLERLRTAFEAGCQKGEAQR